MDEQAAPSDDPVADEALLARFAHGDQTALHDLMRRYMPAALVIANGRLRRAGLADDAVQLAFIKVARHAARFDPARGFAPWFYTILRRVCADLARKEVRYRLCLQRAVPELDVVQQPSDPEAYDAVRTALRGLRPKDREILILRVIEDRPFSEVAHILGCSEEAAKKRGQRALRLLRDQLERAPVPKTDAAAYDSWRWRMENTGETL